MTWQSRIREAAYTSPLGGRWKFDFADVGREVDLRAAAFEFPGVAGAYIQPNLYGARKYPLRCFFSGDNHDLQATRFEELLLQPGTGRLEHPLYGTFDVVPFGTITRRDDLVSAANQSIIEVTFFTTLGAVYPSGQGNPKSEIESTLVVFNETAADQFANAADLRSAISKANTAATVRKLLRDVSAALDDISSATADVRREFADAMTAINFGMNVLIGQPLQLAQQISNLVQAPARAVAGIRSRLEAYEQLALRIIASPAGSGASDGTVLASLRLKTLNAFATSDLFAMSAVSGSVLSVVENTFTTKPEALSAAEDVAAQLDAAVAWREARFGGLGQVDPGGSYQQLQQAVALVQGYLIQVSFSLATERRIVLDRSRTIVDLAAELYGSVDDRLDFLIETNGLTGADILELSKGRSIVYYDG